MNALTKTEGNALAPAASFDLSPRSFDEALRLSDYLAGSTLVPKDFKGNPGNCLIAIQWGMEVGLKPMQALQNIAVINGRPSLWGDAVIALVRASPLCEYITETDDGNTATCRVKRRGQPEEIRTFSMDDAKAAGLAGKDGPWRQYPKRMRQMRARAFACRDVFPDVLKGMPVAEEIMDAPRDIGPAEEVSLWTEQQLEAGKVAASKGAKAYVEFWKGLGAELQQKLAKTREHEQFKVDAQRADANRTVETPPPAAAPTPATTDASTGEIVTKPTDVKAKLEAAKTEDALFVAMDWFNAMTPEDQVASRADLEALFDTRLKALRGE
jgi:hypothetical protein